MVDKKFKPVFKGKFKAFNPNFMQKVVICRKTIKDAFNKRFRSFLTAFVPKLTPKYTTPCIFLHMSNGSSSTFFRCKHPDELVEMLRDMIDTIQSVKWKDAWFEVNDIAHNLIDNKLILDEQFVDINEWNKVLEDTMEVELIAKEERELS